MQTNGCKRIDSVGFITPNTQIKVADLVNGKSLGPNQEGEICFKSPNVMTGYYRNPVETKDMIDNQGNKVLFCIFFF